MATELGPQIAGIDAFDETPIAYLVADEGLINANQVTVYTDGSLWLPILERGVVLRVTHRSSAVE